MRGVVPAMPRFYFHFDAAGNRVRDELGLALPDSEAAWYQAVRSARALLEAEAMIGCTFDGRAVEIEDDRGIRVDRIPLAEIANFAGQG